MTTKQREERRTSRQRRTAAVWQPGAEVSASDRAPVQQAVRRGMRINPRLFSLVLVVLMIGLLAYTFSSDDFYIHSIAVGGLHYMTADEIYGLTNVLGLHVFWIDPAQVRADMLKSPTISDAQVIVGLPPDLMTILISEREPALVWQQAGQASWVDVNGRVMRQREDRPDLLVVQADSSLTAAVGESLSVDVVAGALQLQTLLPTGTTLRYHPDKGLGYNDQRGWLVWLGVGTGMPEKMDILDAMVADLVARNVRYAEINIVNPDSPFAVTLRRQP